MRTAGLILAAGSGARFGQPKAPVVVAGERLVDRAVRLLHEAGADPVLVVLGAWVGEVPGAVVAVNPDWATGMGSSLRAGLAVLAEDAYREVDAVLVTLVDLPGLTIEAVQRVIECPGDLVISAYEGQRGHPVRFSRPHWAGIRAAAHGDTGARDYLRGRSDVVVVEVGDVATGEDLDRPEDLPQALAPRAKPADRA